MKNELKAIEDTILKLLANSTGNILDDVELIDTLGTSKVWCTLFCDRAVQNRAPYKKGTLFLRYVGSLTLRAPA